MPDLQEALLDSLADSVTITIGGASATISAVPSVPERDQFATAKILQFGVRVSDCPATPARGSTAVRFSMTYRVVDLDVNAYAWVKLTCEEV